MEPDLKPDTTLDTNSSAPIRSVQVPKETVSVPSPLRKEQGRNDVNHDKLNNMIKMAEEINDMMEDDDTKDNSGADANTEPNKARRDTLDSILKYDGFMEVDKKDNNYSILNKKLDSSIFEDLKASTGDLKKEPLAVKPKPNLKRLRHSATTLKERKIMLLVLRMLFTLQLASVLYFFLFIQVERALTPSDFPKRTILLLLFSFAFPPIIPDLVVFCFEPSDEIWKKPIQDIWVHHGLEKKKDK